MTYLQALDIIAKNALNDEIESAAIAMLQSAVAEDRGTKLYEIHDELKQIRRNTKNDFDLGHNAHQLMTVRWKFPDTVAA